MTSTQRQTATLLLIALASCVGPPAATEAEDSEQLLARIEQFNEAIREGDVEKYTDVFVDDFVFTWAPDGQIYTPEEIFSERRSHAGPCSQRGRARRSHLRRRRDRKRAHEATAP